MIGNENLFLIALALVWIIGSIMQDLRRREVDNIWNFSLIAFALGYRLFFSVFSGNYWFFINGILGFVIFLVIGNLLYYSRVFAGGDTKLMIALGTILPLSYDWIVNFKIFGWFVILSLFMGGIYILIWGLSLMVLNWRAFNKSFARQFVSYRIIFLISLIFAVLWLLLGFIDLRFILISLVIFLFPFLFIFSKSVEESCLTKFINNKEVTVGDWLARDIKVSRKIIKADWNGISETELKLLQKTKQKVWVKYGIPFTPAFLFGFVVLLYVLRKGYFGF